MKSRLRLITLWVTLVMFIVPAFPSVASGAPLILSPTPPLSTEEAAWTIAPVPVMYDPNPIPIRVEARTAAADLLSPSGANMIIDYVPNGSYNKIGDACVTFPEQAKAPFQDAANKLGALIASAVPIRIEGCWASLKTGVIGHSLTISYHRDFTNSQPGTWYPVALANALYGDDLKPASVCTNTSKPASNCDDISIAFATAFTDTFYYGTDGHPGGKTDFESVVMHEIMHGLGFAGGMQIDSGPIGFWTSCDYPIAYDRFTIDGSNISLINTGAYPCPGAALAGALTSNNIYFNGANAKAANSGNRVPLFAPSSWMGGSSYAHLAESYNGTVNAQMTYSIGPGEVLQDPGPIGLGVLRDVGWLAPVTYSISGQILLSGGGAASGVTVSDGAGHTTSTDGSGNYTLSGLAAGTYTITPSKAGYTFAPGNRSVTIAAANQTGIDFTATLIIYSVSGQILLSGGGAATGVTVSDDAGHTTSSDGSGNYTLSGLAPDTYTITPSKAGYTFAPGNRSVTLTAANQTGIDFTATLITYSVSGQILNSSGGAAAEVTVGDGTGHTTTTDANGNYTLSGLAPGTYTITPSKAGYTFTPANQSVVVIAANQTGINFTMITYSVSGQITLSGGGGTAGVTISDGAGHTAVSNASGNYTITGMAAGTYTITPSKTDYIFSPPTRSATITTANVTGVDFIVTTYSISGQITLNGGGPAIGISVMDGAGHTTTTNSTGNYTFTNLPPGSYTLWPFKIGKVFQPAYKAVTISASSSINNNFVAFPGLNLFMVLIKK